MVIKTGCSASLVALHEACRAIAAGDAESAVVGGTSLILTATITAAFASERLLSPEGSCKTFDASADGFTRAEAVTAVFVKPLAAALRDGNPVRGVIRATGTNADGKGEGLLSPNGAAQEALMRKVYRDAGLDPADTAFVEVSLFFWPLKFFFFLLSLAAFGQFKDTLGLQTTLPVPLSFSLSVM